MFCPKCDKRHMAKRVHQELRGNVLLRSYSCERCGYLFTTEESIVDSDALAQGDHPLTLSIFIDMPASLLPDPFPSSDAELIRQIQSQLEWAEAVHFWLLLRFAASPTTWRLRRNGLWGVPHLMVLQEFEQDGIPVDVAKDREEHVLDADGLAHRLILRQVAAGSEEFVLGF